VLKLINPAHAKGISVIFITHNINHAYPVGDTFTLLNRGRWLGTFAKSEVAKDSARHDGRWRGDAEPDGRTRGRDDLTAAATGT
jgi:ABC-type glutathione transport system ATPase component